MCGHATVGAVWLLDKLGRLPGDRLAIRTKSGRVESLCARIGSMGLYPYAVFDRQEQIVDARQFPQASGYPKDTATGIAASAFSFGLLSNGIVEASERPWRSARAARCSARRKSRSGSIWTARVSMGAGSAARCSRGAAN